MKHPAPRWTPGPRRPALDSGEVHLWQASLDSDPDSLPAPLSPEERERAARFRFERDRARWVVSRGILRNILARYLGLDAAAIRFHLGPHGKPELDGHDLRFNASHSGDLVLYGVALERRIGVDVERLDPRPAAERVPERFFSAEEVARLRALPPAEQPAAFFRCWTLKEAYVKALGGGLSIPLDSFRVDFSPRAGRFRIGGWSLESLAPRGGYAAAVAVEGDGWTLARYSWR